MDTYNYDEETSEILQASYLDEIKKTEIHIFDYETAAAIFNITVKELESLIWEVEKTARHQGFKKGFNKCFYDNTINIVGMYLLCFYNKENSTNHLFNRYLEFFSNKTNFFTVKLLGNLLSDRTERRYASSGKISEEEYLDILATRDARTIDSYLKIMKEEVEDTSHIFYRKKIVITGLFDAFPERNEIAQLLHNVGADVNGTISKKTDFVIVGKGAGWKKLETIQELNIPTIDEQRLIEIFNK